MGLDKVYHRHGRVDLVPLPADGPDDPLNWPSWRKHVVLFLVSFHAFLAIFSSAIIIPAYFNFAQEFDVSVTRASYLTAVHIVFLGVSPVLWGPLSARYGRRPLYLFSSIASAACTLGGAYCRSYGTLMTTRVFQAICVSPPLAIGAATVKEVFFQHEIGQKMGVWTLLVTIGPPLGPLLGGFIVQNKGWHWLFYLLAILSLALFFGYLFFGPETLYMRPSRTPDNLPASGSSDTLTTPSTGSGQTWSAYVRFRRIDPRPLRPAEFVRPFRMALRPPVLLCTIAYSVAFAYAGVLLTVLVPQFFGAKFGLDAAQVGLQFVALVIGAVLGEQVAGYGSDRLVRWRSAKAGGAREPEMRLPASYPGFVLAAVGLVIWGVRLQQAKEGRWNVTPDVGGGIAYFGLQLVTTPVYAYCLETYKEDAAAVATFVLVVRQVSYYYSKGSCSCFLFVDLAIAVMAGSSRGSPAAWTCFRRSSFLWA
ncbi:MFS general substrate transporter [Punctularia strigosozonata HHB-11173 SS5]|uniref:MFS general substrate transporter n=1 Tax=Punctularia strigosozonata (strain HHB-11173) TaxID=741275 RepID=UPI00044186D8|nr:MFS general substrate transporter [Punctularia strigosozonata HHB-11173 SS5]EIN08489.1 MFS general substrate transporter [Punctularia strigosozonata HHB-11173 SS5]